MAVSDLPVLVDGDNGYGDYKSVVHVVHQLERLGAQAIFFEDQVSPKRCDHIAGKALVSCAEMEVRTVHSKSFAEDQPKRKKGNALNTFPL